MSTIIQFNRLFVSSESHSKCFHEEFSQSLNIISGRNTSGKSSLIQSLIFIFGINDVAEQLNEILDYKPTFRLDFTKKNGDLEEQYVIIRAPSSIYIKEPNGKVIHFYGIDGNNSAEHVKLKEYIRKLVGFNLFLEQKGELKSASLETMFLPYYISQSVGWVYLRESFSNLQYYKDFKDDYLDYYLGISNNFNRIKHSNLIKERDSLAANINNLKKYSKKPELQFSKLIDEEFGDKANEYIESYIKKEASLEDERNKYIRFCNDLSLLKNHHKILKRTKRNIKNQNYNDIDRCPACTQILSYSLEGLYSHYQKYNDTVELESHITKKLTDKTSDINSSNSKMLSISNEIHDDYDVVLKNIFNGVTFEQWIASKANISLYKKIQVDIDEHQTRLSSIKESISNMATEQETINARLEKEKLFKKIFLDYMLQLKIKPLTDSRYLQLYKINSFPRQGVELHKTVMAYHFALNNIILQSETAHRLPFLLDAILKEDIDETNLETILSFIGKNLPRDTQTFISISEHIKNPNEENIKPIEKIRVKDVQESHFPKNSKLLYIADGEIERGFLSQNLYEYKELYIDTINIITS